MSELELVTLTEAQIKARKGRSLALAIALIAIVVAFYGITVFKMGSAVLSRAF
jgi:hypothetical protein